MQQAKTSQGWFVVKRKENFVAWCAWREWLATRCGYRFFPEARTVPLAWPPETIEDVKFVVGKLNESRTIANADKKVGGKLLPMLQEELAPWDRWDINKTLEMERRHRADPYWNPRWDGRADPEEKLIGPERAQAVIDATRKRYAGYKDRRFVPGRPDAPEQDEQREPTRLWHTPEQLAEIRRNALKNRLPPDGES